VDPLDDRTWRVYYSTRDAQNRSRTSFVELAADEPSRVTYVHDRPVMELGELGAFDDSGVMPSWVVTVGATKYLYYTGWTARVSVPYHNAIGLAVSHDGGRTFERAWAGPVFGPTHDEPHFTGTACVLVENGVFRNWYLSCVGWARVGDKVEPRYDLKYAESRDGVVWQRGARVAIGLASPAEGGLVRASVLKRNGGYSMWYSRRGTSDYRTDRAQSYRMGYAESPDGVTWTRLDEQAGLDVSDAGWDAEMVAYPHVLEHTGGLRMFYNGNGFGRSGFGWARAAVRPRAEERAQR
jgi:hypothetical protein